MAAAAAVAALACSRTTELLPTPVTACVAPGPPIRLGGTDAASCTGALSARFGRYALCSCSDLTLTGILGVGGPAGPAKTQGGPGPNGGPGPAAPAPRVFTASVGTDGNLKVAFMSEVAGSLITAGTRDATFVHGGHIQGNLRGGGGFKTMTTMGVWVSGEMTSSGDVSGMFRVVGGSLRVPSGAVLAPEVQAMTVVREPVAVPPPCNCGAAPAIDLAAAVGERRARNANATLAFPETLLADVHDPETLDLPCGEFWVPEIRTAGTGVTLELRVHGRAALFVGGDVHLGDTFTVTLDDGAELDLVVAGSLYTMGRVFGSPATPARTRLWVGGATVSLPGHIQFGAAVYAPMAVFSASEDLRFSGSLYVDTFSVEGDVSISYDPEIPQAGALCGVAPPPIVE